MAPPALPAALARAVDPVIDALWLRFSRRTAMAHVRYVSQFWRLSGNLGFDATINRIHTRLVEVGFRDDRGASTGPSPVSAVWAEEYPNSGKGWRYTTGTVAIAHSGAADEVVLSREQQNLSLCINSFSTTDDGLVAPLVDVGRGADADYSGKDLKGAVVLGDADAGQLWRRAMSAGARGVISTSLGEYISPDLPGAPATPRDQWNILQWGSIPYDEARRSFGFKATPRAAATLRRALAAAGNGRVLVHVTIASTFSTKPNRMLIAEIPGSTLRDQRIVITAHVQEPGANDNASGVATLVELARALRDGIRSGAIPRPDRTITFLWLEEISGSQRWLRDHADEAKGVRYMFSMDMTGEDVRKTGGSFLIERSPDPGAVWDRPWDPHTEWGRGDVKESQLKGDLINDLHLAICARVAAKTGRWVVKTNPYEGGSDHTVFGNAGIPSVLDWHFTDRYYHSNYDTADKTSPSEMRNVGVAVAASAWVLGSAKEDLALSVAALVARAGEARLVIEQREGARLAAAEADRNAASRQQDQIVQAWKKWYAEAVRSAVRLLAKAPSTDFTTRLNALAETFAPKNGSGN